MDSFPKDRRQGIPIPHMTQGSRGTLRTHTGITQKTVPMVAISNTLQSTTGEQGLPRMTATLSTAQPKDPTQAKSTGHMAHE